LKYLMIVFVCAALLSGCKGELIDSVTKNELKAVKPQEGTISVKINDDYMLGNIDYSHSPLVVDPNAYSGNEIQRGDVVYFQYPPNRFQSAEKKSVLRVVALSGEKIRIKKGQVYIDGKRLNTFYGKDLYNDLDRLQREIKKKNLDDSEIENIKNRIRIVENDNVDEITVPENTIYLVGDNRAGALDSRQIGAIPISNVIGKVMGQNCSR